MTRPKIFGLLGYPVSHSLSPLMQNAAFKARRIKAVYKLFEVKPKDLKDFFNNLKKKNICGLNVTIPYKETVIPFLKVTTPAVKTIGAVNTVTIDRDGNLTGHNTDYIGFTRHLYTELKLRPQKVAIIGSGGASKAVVFALCKKKVKEISIYDIDRYKALGLANHFRQIFHDCNIKAVGSIPELDIKNADLLINATGVGMKNDDPCLVDAQMLGPKTFVYDLIYNPGKTKLLSLAENAGCRFSNGLGMLIHQGAEAFNLWMKPKKAPVEVMLRALLEGHKV
jgi:shikimate dehydrogenase